MNKEYLIKGSKKLSYVLRHRPDHIGIQLDSKGWADVGALLVGFNLVGLPLTFNQLNEIVATNDKQRFAFNKDKTKIRANQGHSADLNIKVDLNRKTPPITLYHGTSIHSIDSIKKGGLQPMNRTHVHLSNDVLTAAKVGARKGKYVILEIKTELMHSAGYNFYLSDNNVWLTDAVPSRYIVFPKVV